MEYNDFTIVIKSNESRTFTAYVSVEVVDLQGDIIPAEVLSESMVPYVKRGGHLLLIHKNIPVGKITEFFKTTHPKTGKPAIAVHGEIFNDGSSIYNDVWSKFTDSSASVGFSIGAKPIRSHLTVVNGKNARVYDKIELYEISVLCEYDKREYSPANQFANLIGLGHKDVANLSPVSCKMMIKMTETQETQESNTASDSKNEEKPVIDIDAENIRKQVMTEADHLIGGSATLELLKTQNGKISELENSIALLTKQNKSLQDKLEEEKSVGLRYADEIKKAQIKADVWKEMYTKIANSSDVIKNLVTSQEVVLNRGVMPSNLGTQYYERELNIKKSIDEDMESINKVISGDSRNISDEEFRKVADKAFKLKQRGLIR